MPTALCMGELLIDLVSPEWDVSLEEARTFAKAPGGAPANVAVGLARLGISSGFLGKVGADPFGLYLQRVLAQEGVDTTGLRLDPEVRTTLAFIATHSDGRKDILFYRNPGADMMLSRAEVDPQFIRSASVLHYGSVSFTREPCRSACFRALEIAAESGLLLTYDPNLRLSLWESPEVAREWIWKGMAYAHIVKMSEEEWEFITGTSDPIAGSAKVLEAGPRAVIQTRGAEGCYFDDGENRGYVPGFKVQVVDPLGAGDGFMASLIKSLLWYWQRGISPSQSDWEKICRTANAGGALTTLKVGVIPALPTQEEIDQFLKEN